MSNTITNQNFIEVGDRIRQKRKEVNMTQKELAEKIGMADKHLSRLEMGLTNMKLDTFFTVATALGVSPNDIAPKHLLQKCPQSSFAALEEKYNLLNERQQQVVFATVTALLTSIAQQNI